MTDSSKNQTHPHPASRLCFTFASPRRARSSHNRESTARQYALADRAAQLGWPKEQVVIIDEDLGLSGSSTDKRSGFAAPHQRSRPGSRRHRARTGSFLALRRNNADWYRLLELCGVTDTLIWRQRWRLSSGAVQRSTAAGLKGTIVKPSSTSFVPGSMAAIRNKAARGELRRGLPVGMVWGERDGEVLFHPDEAVTGAIRTVFEAVR